MASFNSYLPLLTAVEGGYQKDPQDNGNYNSLGKLVGTNYGISAPVYEAWLGYAPTEQDMRNLTPTIAKEIFKAWYWNKMQANNINNQSIANLIVDHAVNAGTFSAAKLTQKTLNTYFGLNLVGDGVIGNKTISAINFVNAAQLHEHLKEARKQYYINIGGYWLDGWLNRLDKFVYSEKKKLCPCCLQWVA